MLAGEVPNDAGRQLRFHPAMREGVVDDGKDVHGEPGDAPQGTAERTEVAFDVVDAAVVLSEDEQHLRASLELGAEGLLDVEAVLAARQREPPLELTAGPAGEPLAYDLHHTASVHLAVQGATPGLQIDEFFLVESIRLEASPRGELERVAVLPVKVLRIDEDFAHHARVVARDVEGDVAGRTQADQGKLLRAVLRGQEVHHLPGIR